MISGYNVYRKALNYLVSRPNDAAFLTMCKALQTARIEAQVARLPQDDADRQEGTQIVVAAILISTGVANMTDLDYDKPGRGKKNAYK